jgi:uncharacterized protein YndB with AHSA1/START domain
MSQEPFRVPDLASRPFSLTAGRTMAAAPGVLYRAWTERFDQWFAAPGSVLMTAEVNTPFFFETEYAPEPGGPVNRHPHYGRFLRLEPDRLVELTWVTGAGGTEGAETVLTVALTPHGAGTRLELAHAGFASEGSCRGAAESWPPVLEQLDRRTAPGGPERRAR